jgi:hypothetical protein
MAEDSYLMSETDVDRLRELLEAVHFAMIEFIDSRKLKIPPWEEQDHPELENTQAILDEVRQEAQRNFDF